MEKGKTSGRAKSMIIVFFSFWRLDSISLGSIRFEKAKEAGEIREESSLCAIPHLRFFLYILDPRHHGC